MRKFLSLLALMLLCSIGASAAFTPSTLADPVKYTLVNKNSMGITSRLTYLGYDPEDAGAGLFIFIEQSGTNRYKIYETTSKKYIGLVGGASTQGKSYTRLVADEADAEVFTITAANTTYNLISPTSLGTTYLNFHGGADQNKSGQTIGFWTDGASDNGSCWQFIEYSLTWKKPQFGGTVWTYNTSTNQFDADGKTSTAAPERSDNKGPVYKFENVGTVSSPVGDVNTSDFGGIRVLGNGDNVTSKLGNWAGSIEVEKFAIANVTYGIDLKGREPANSATVWVDGELNFGTARTSFSMNDGTNGETQGQRWYIGENGVIKSAFTSVNRGTRTWDLQVVVADEPEQAGYKRVRKTISKKVMTWGANISSNINSLVAYYKDAEGNYTELPQTAVTYDATGITITYEGYTNEFEYISLKNKQHSFYVGYRTSDNKIEGSLEKNATTTWEVVATDDGKYMLKNGEYYMGAVPTAHDQENSLTTSEANAEKFIITKNGDYYTLQLSQEDTGCSSHHNYLHGVNWTAYPARGIVYTTVRWAADSDASKWIIEIEEAPVSGDYTINCTGLAAGVEGGVTYNCVNYTGTLLLSGDIDEEALIAMHVSNYNGTIASVDTENHIINVAYDQEYKATSVLWDGNGDVNNTKVPAARIPAMVKAQNGDILAFSDWRYSRDDVGRSTFNLGYQVDIEMRRSSDGGQTWSPAIIVANGDGGNDRTTAGYGDASVVADSESGKVLLMCVNAAGSNRFVRYTSDDNGVTWSGPVNVATLSAFSSTGCTFVTSGKMVQSRDFKKAGAAAKRIYAPLCGGTADYVLYSDDFGQTWNRLGDGAAQTGTNNECRLVELPNGDLLLDSRAATVRKLNVFTYTSREDATGSWGEMNVNGNMPTVDCNGDIDLVTGYAVGSAEPVQILLETAPRGSNNGASRAHVQYYYKVLTDGQYTLNDVKSDWVAGYEVCAGKSAYSSIINLGNGVEAILYEKAHSDSETGYNGNPWGYDIKFETHTLLEITNGAYTHEPTLPVTVNYTLTDANGATYTGSYEGIVGTAPTFTGAHGYTLSDEHWGEVADNAVDYTATINFPFPVSSNDVHNWVNIIYLPNYDRYVSYNGTDLKIAQQFKTSAQNDPGDNKNTPNYVWSVTPVLDAATKSFGFKIYNVGADKYVSANGMVHRAAVSLADEGDVFSLIAPTAAPANATHKDTNKGVFVKSDGSNTFSICIEGAASSNFLTFWNVTTSSHAGQNLDIVAAENPEVPSDADVAALQAEIDGLTINHMIGEVGYPTWYCQEVQTLMGGYCTNFSTEGVSGMVTVVNYNDALEALNAFYSATDVVMPQDGKAYTISNVTPNGSKRMLYYRNDGGMFNNYLRASDNNTNPGYEHTFYCRQVGENKFVFVNEMGIYVEFQRALEHAAGETYRSNYNDFTFAKMVNEENPRAAFGTFCIYGTLENIGEGYLTARSGSFNSPSATLLFNDDDAGSTAFVLTEVENPNKEKASNPNPGGSSKLDGKFVGTFSANYNVELRNGLKAYTAALTEDKTTVVFTLLGEDGTIVPKRTGVLLYAEDATAPISVNAIPAISTVAVENNIFLATNGSSVTLNEGDLVLGNGNNGVGFYLINPDKRTVARNKAYIPGSVLTASVGRYVFDFDVEGSLTGINGFEVAPAADNMFDLQGRRVQNAQKGLYIINGKKVVR